MLRLAGCKFGRRGVGSASRPMICGRAPAVSNLEFVIVIDGPWYLRVRLRGGSGHGRCSSITSSSCGRPSPRRVPTLLKAPAKSVCPMERHRWPRFSLSTEVEDVEIRIPIEYNLPFLSVGSCTSFTMFLSFSRHSCNSIVFLYNVLELPVSSRVRSLASWPIFGTSTVLKGQATT
jgi:hypothetical protein